MASKNGEGTLDERMQIVMICQELHWTFEQYCSQPDWFMQALRIKLREDAMAAKRSKP